MHATPAGLGAVLQRFGGRAARPSPRIRPIRRSDAQAVRAFVVGLSNRSRLLRYFRPLRELPEQLLRQLTEADGERDAVFVALARDAAGTRIVGLAQYARTDVACCEFALVIADAWQGQGLGRRLLQRLLGAAQSAGVAQMHGDVLRENRAMLGLARAMGFSVSASPLDPSALRVTRDLERAARPMPRFAAQRAPLPA